MATLTWQRHICTSAAVADRGPARKRRGQALPEPTAGAVSLLMGALYEGKIVSNNVKRRHLNSSQRAMAVAMMYPEARHGGSRQAGSSSATELDISKDRLSMARTVLRALPTVALSPTR